MECTYSGQASVLAEILLIQNSIITIVQQNCFEIDFSKWKIQPLIISTQKTGEKSGLVVRAEGSCPRGRGFESSRILDGCKRC